MGSLKEALLFLISSIQTASVWDILDILIVAYLIYRIITVVRKTSSSSVIKGIILLLAVMWLSSLLNLNVINFLLGQTMKLGVLVLIILFQPELRRFLEQMGSSRFKFLFSRTVKTSYMETCIANTVAACMEMSRMRMGALIVFEREIALVDHIKTGTRLDSILSVELVMSIFFPKSPLHDGAVIVRDGRITAAGCMLPMTSNTNISRDLGMRHRAGIGMSEVSDAVVVIVSEETGSISVAIDGMLKRHLAHDTFEKLLRNELLTNEMHSDAKSRLRDKIKVKK
jgi:diadenylate cyclase